MAVTVWKIQRKRGFIPKDWGTNSTNFETCVFGFLISMLGSSQLKSGAESKLNTGTMQYSTLP